MDPYFNLTHKLKILRKALHAWNWEVFGDVNHNVTTRLMELDVVQEVIACDGGLDFLFSNESDLQASLHAWNWEVFGDVNHNVTTRLMELDAVQEVIACDGGLDFLFSNESDLQASLTEAFRVQEIFWKEKSRTKWLADGDRNTSFFHSMCKIRKVHCSISLLKNGSTILEDPCVIQSHVVQFYYHLFAAKSVIDTGLVEKVIPSLVTTEENLSLIAFPSVEEIFVAVKQMDPSSALGPDGFSDHFFSECWDIVGKEVVYFVQQFFRDGFLSVTFNSSFMILIPKVDNVVSMGQYQPIALENFLFKIIPKILSMRLAPIASQIISPQ
ncbi:hypothetical protein CerSpe_205370 [Prunus speciosa]